MTFTRLPCRIFAATMLVLALGLSACTSAVVKDEPVIVAAAEHDGYRVAFYGDSYTYGTGATSEQRRWSTVLSEQYGWSEFNPSVSGLGFMRNRELFGEGDVPGLIIGDNPDAVIVTIGLNDNFTYKAYADELPGQIMSDFERLSMELPNTRLIVVEPFWYKTERPASVDVIISWVRDAAREVGADYIPDASYWVAGHPEWMASDNLHPNDAGHAEIAAQMDRALRTLGR
ncbi:lysophospholipase L1-like esterase [Rhodoglobus vestalii]|uniref:Lysophospholipase L1-like esterase n=1 Tax=Rhodoglobus vestalii TaxID=193384 RepID=A0A8H2K667_9MICO|nr:SGNH/GDSL hydrolase family protein [Rhodoglobus vestalii]TQO19414.1 lysophospholipase L1-like esterase [Rhodoglobus vestalii]